MAPRAKTPPSPREAPTDDIDKLNAIVRKRVYDMGGDGIEPEAVKAVKGGAQVYHRRTRALVYGVGVLAVAMLAGAPSAAFAAAALAAMWIVTDVYGAVLHVVLDTPEFINAPIVSAVIGEGAEVWGGRRPTLPPADARLTPPRHTCAACPRFAGPACLEFQWHHSE